MVTYQFADSLYMKNQTNVTLSHVNPGEQSEKSRTGESHRCKGEGRV